MNLTAKIFEKLKNKLQAIKNLFINYRTKNVKFKNYKDEISN